MSATITDFPRTTASTTMSGRARAARAESDRTETSTGTETFAGTKTSAGTETSPRTRLRLTRRGRAVITLLVVIPLLAVLAAFMLNGGGASATSQAGDVHFQHITVTSGETMWQIAEQVAPSADPRDVIIDIQKLNNLDTTELQPGQQLAIPLKYSQR